MASNSGNMAAASGDERLRLLAAVGRRLAGYSDLNELRRTIIDEASRAVARLHGLASSRTMFLRQSPRAIDAGAFHTDVLAVADRDLLLVHEAAFADALAAIESIRRLYRSVHDEDPSIVVVDETRLTLEEAVATYLFNSQLLSRPDGARVMLAPAECERSERAQAVIRSLCEQGHITECRFAEVRQSMRNGGGPACLRLRVVLTSEQLAAVHRGVLWSEALDEQLTQWIETHYRDELRLEDLRDPGLLDESRRALAALRRILDLEG